ncbi:hypothetical protein, partial [Pseudomonas marginalis]|uniref:hypothetical protein n=1 Tax=Pseudomonas marginalis TaxID=298 RepID=UPI0034D3D1BA
ALAVTVDTFGVEAGEGHGVAPVSIGRLYAEIFSGGKRKTLLRCDFFSGRLRGMKTALEIIDYVGQERIASALDLKPDAIRKARSAGIMP